MQLVPCKFRLCVAQRKIFLANETRPFSYEKVKCSLAWKNDLHTWLCLSREFAWTSNSDFPKTLNTLYLLYKILQDKVSLIYFRYTFRINTHYIHCIGNILNYYITIDFTSVKDVIRPKFPWFSIKHESSNAEVIYSSQIRARFLPVNCKVQLQLHCCFHAWLKTMVTLVWLPLSHL